MNYKMMKLWAQGIIVHINIAGDDIDNKYLKDLVWHLQDCIAEDEQQ